MTFLKQKVKDILSYPIAFYILIKAKKNICYFKEKRIFLFDIDNTIANSWHSLTLNHWTSENERLKGLAIFLRMKKLLSILQSNKNNKIFFLTARSYFSRATTIEWLTENGILVENSELIITRTAEDKIKIIKALPLNNFKKIYFIDDLSHKHETMHVEMFEKEIRAIEELAKKHNQTFSYYGKNLIDTFCEAK